MVVHPTTTYLYKEAYGGFDRMFNAPKFVHEYGVCNGSVVENQLPLFLIHQTFPIYRRMFSTVGFDHYLMTLVGVSLLDFRYKNNIGICLDDSQSKSVQHLSKLYQESGLPPGKPVQIKINNKDEENFTDYKVKINYEEIEYISDNYLFRGESLSRYEINKVVENKSHLPRFWRQSEIMFDISKIICDNQLELF